MGTWVDGRQIDLSSVDRQSVTYYLTQIGREGSNRTSLNLHGDRIVVEA